MEGSAGIYRDAESLVKGARQAAGAAGTAGQGHRSRTTAGPSTPSWSPPSSWTSCSTSPRPWSSCALRREESRGAHQRTDFPNRDDERFLAHSLVSRGQDGSPRRRVPTGDDHPLAARRTGLREVSGMPDTITLQVARYRPESDSAPRMQEYVVPLREDWAVLDGLNYIKDRLDGTLSFRWSCRMGICGSCGMTVNGDPALTCGDVPRRLRAGTGAGRAAWRTFRSSVTSSSRSTTSCASCPRSSRGWCARTSIRSPTSSFSRRQPSWRRTSSTACASTACSATRRARSTPSNRISSARLRSRSPSGTTSTPAIRARTSGWTYWPPQRGYGPARMSGNAPAPAPRASIPASAIQRYKLTAATQTLRSLLLPRGAR